MGKVLHKVHIMGKAPRFRHGAEFQLLTSEGGDTA